MAEKGTTCMERGIGKAEVQNQVLEGVVGEGAVEGVVGEGGSERGGG